MVVKQAKVINVYWHQMFCDKCGAVMKTKGERFANSRRFLYECPKCHHIQASKNLYPMPTFEFDSKEAVVVEEDTLVRGDWR